MIINSRKKPIMYLDFKVKIPSDSTGITHKKIKGGGFAKYFEGTDAKRWKKNYMTVPAAIRELEKIESIRQSDHGYRMDYAVKATQKEILKAFNMTAVNARTQAAAINEELMKIEKEG